MLISGVAKVKTINIMATTQSIDIANFEFLQIVVFLLYRRVS